MSHAGLSLTAAALWATLAAVAAADPLLPRIVATAQDGTVSLSALTSGPEGATITGTLSITKHDGSNTVRTSQSSTKVLKGGSETVIAETAINMSDRDTLVAILELAQDGKVRSRTTLETGPSAIKTP